MALGKGYAGQDCSLARALELVGERWTILVLRDAFYGVRRFNDFATHLGIPRAVLAERLHGLVEAGVLITEQYRESPAREEYVLTQAGRELWPALYTLAQWGERHRSTGGPRRIFRHAACGTRLDVQGHCARCDRAVPPEDVDTEPGPGADPDVEDPVSVALRDRHRLLEPLAVR